MSDSLDQILKKYGKIWVWSILLTLSAAELMRTMGSLNMAVFNLKSLPGLRIDLGALVIPTIAGMVECIAVFLSLFWLFKFMLSEVLPIFFSDGGESRGSDGAELLYRAFGATLIGVGAQLGGHILVLIWRLIG